MIPIERVESKKIELQIELRVHVRKVNTDLSIFNFEEPHDNPTFENKNTQESLNEQIFNDEPMFLNKLFEGEFDYNHEKIVVEEPRFSSNHVEEVVSISKTHFERKPLNLNIFTFEDTTTM